MLRFKSCPKCKSGDMVIDRDNYGSYMLCLQCGLLKYLGLPNVSVTTRLVPHPVDKAT